MARGQDSTQEGLERVDEVLNTWLKMSLEENALARACRYSILNSITEGFVVGSNWFSDDDRGEFLDHMSGTEDERRALACVLDSITMESTSGRMAS
ncbi:MAG: hypothetical protein Ct9H90mP1_0640 [Methanobacteriota archaeon]|nr:MAG: hypothetical protein Ct9H90mP1_0640 [Euryarchaeota archaeon]